MSVLEADAAMAAGFGATLANVERPCWGAAAAAALDAAHRRTDGHCASANILDNRTFLEALAAVAGRIGDHVDHDLEKKSPKRENLTEEYDTQMGMDAAYVRQPSDQALQLRSVSDIRRLNDATGLLARSHTLDVPDAE
jgi:hypothetical protein